MKSGKVIPGLFLVIAVNLLLRLPYVINIPIINYDEAYLAVKAAAMIETGAVMYRDIFGDGQPLFYYLYVTAFRLSGTTNILVVQLFGVAWALLTTAVLYRITRLISSPRAAFITAVFYAVGSTLFDPPDMVAANSELFMVLPLSLGALFFIRGLKFQSGRNFLAAGILAGTGFLFKQPGVMDLGAMLLFLVLLVLAGKSSIAGTGKNLAEVFAGFLVPVAAVLAWLFSRGALGDYYSGAWAFRFRYVEAAPLLPGLLTVLNMLKRLLLANFVLAIFALASIFFRPSVKLGKGYAYCWIWGLFSLAGAAAGRRPFPHYYIQVIPPFAILAGLGACGVLERVRYRWKGKNWRGGILKAAIAAALILSVFISHRSTSPGWHEMNFGNFFAFREFEHPKQKLADHIRENTLRSDTIYIWGFSPHIYYLSGRRPASRFFNIDPIIGFTPPGKSFEPVPEYMESFLEDLKSNRPAFFIDTSFSPHDRFCADNPVARYSKLWEFLHANYEIDTVIDRKLFYRLRESELEVSSVPFPAEQSLSESPGQPDFRLGGGRLRGPKHLSLADFDQDAAVSYHQAVVLSDSGRFIEAVRKYREAIRPHLDHASAHIGIGVLLGMSGRYRDAEAMFQGALEIDPGSAIARFNLCVLYLKMGRSEDFLREFSVLKKDFPNLAGEFE